MQKCFGASFLAFLGLSAALPVPAAAAQICGTVSVAALNQLPGFRCRIGRFDFSNFLDESFYQFSNPLAYDVAFASAPGRISITFQSLIEQISIETPADPFFATAFVWPGFSFDLRSVRAGSNIFAMAIGSGAHADFMFVDPTTFGSLSASSSLFALDGSVGWGGPSAQCSAALSSGGASCDLPAGLPQLAPFPFVDGARVRSSMQLQLDGNGVQGDARAVLDRPSWTVDLYYRVTPTPEPATMALLATGLGLIAVAGFRRRVRGR